MEYSGGGYLMLGWPVAACVGVWEAAVGEGVAVRLDVADDILKGILFCAVLFPTRCRTELSQFLRILLHTHIDRHLRMLSVLSPLRSLGSWR